MALRWCAAGMVEAGKQFRRVNGYLHLPALRAALEAEVANTVTGSVRGSGGGGSGLMIIGAATEVPRNSGHPRPAARRAMAWPLSGSYQYSSEVSTARSMARPGRTLVWG